MASVGTVLLSQVWAALKACIPGYRTDPTGHHWVVYPPDGGQPYWRLPKGGHGSRKKARVERGHVRRMGRQFKVLECFEQHIQGL